MTDLFAEKFATDVLAALAALEGFATLAIDFNRTHASNPQWPGHARFHLVWQNGSTAMLAMMTEYVLWSGTAAEKTRFHLALWMTALPMLGFLAALLSKGLYGGSTYDENGILPLCIRLGRYRNNVDLNTAAVLSGFVMLGFVFYLHDLR